MKRFRFRLETLLDMRKRAEDAVKQLLAAKNREILGARETMAELHRKLSELQSSEKQKRAAADNVVTLRYSVVYRHQLKQEMLRKGREIDDLLAQASRIRNDLVKATKERRAIEIVRERRFDEWKKEYRTQERNFLDDISQQKFIRRTRKGQANDYA